MLLDAPGLESYAPSVNLDVAQGARELARHLAASGHIRAAYVDGVTGTTTFQLRREASWQRLPPVDFPWLTGTSSAPRSTSVLPPLRSPLPGRSGNARGVTAVVCGTDTHAYGVLQEARVEGVHIPEELAVAGFDDLPYSATSNPPSLTSVHLPATPLGRKAGGAAAGG